MPGHWPSFVNSSLWQTPQACTLMRTSPALGLGISRSTISKSAPALGICATFIGAIPTFVVAIEPPRERSSHHPDVAKRNRPSPDAYGFSESKKAYRVERYGLMIGRTIRCWERQFWTLFFQRRPRNKANAR